MKQPPKVTPSKAVPKLATPRIPRLRRLSDEEIELWQQVAASVTPRRDAHLPQRLVTPPAAVAAPPIATPTGGPVAPLVKRPVPPPFAPLERTLKRKLSRGRMTADAAIDLHGLRQDAAYGVLHRFLVGAQHDGARVVIVVTGKGSTGTGGIGKYGAGDPYAGAPGVLRRAVPLWLALPEFRPLVVGFEEAGRAHGGAGALYIRLRRGPRG